MSARITTRMRVALVGAAATAALLAPAAVANGEESAGLPGMYRGRSDPSTTVIAHANGTPKYILNIETDAAGQPTGVLILGRSADRVYVDDFCRLWQHLPGQEYGGHGDGHESLEGATTAHAVGIGTLKEGTRVLVRTDVRETDEGAVYRARYRPLGASGGHEDDGATAHDESADTAHDDQWTAVPAEGWAPLDRMDVR